MSYRTEPVSFVAVTSMFTSIILFVSANGVRRTIIITWGTLVRIGAIETITLKAYDTRTSIRT